MENILQNLDTSVFLFFNGLHDDWADVFFYYVSSRFAWIPLYALILFLVIKKFRRKAIGIIVLFVAIVFCTDQTCNLIKNSVQRPRPSHEVSLEGKVHLIDYPDGKIYRGGAFGFPSSHAANSIAVAFLTAFFVCQKKRWGRVAIFLWALLLGYSRLYLGVHYPSDLAVGYLIGAVYALGGIWLWKKIMRQQN